ncbi:Hint domain-containing protein [Ascidiaceihabitans sp.]|nr:Hint domain-containing protein [Ascidiaceihabitans sp.]
MTTLLGQLTQQPYTPQRPLMQAPTPREINPMTRNIEIAALGEDQKMHVAQLKAPSIPLFDSALSAFARGSLMSTPNGEIAVEDLLPGEELNTSTGEPAKILWIGSSTFVPAAPDRRMPLIRIMADTFGQSRPSSFLTVGPSARLLQTPHHLRGDNNGTRMFTKAEEFVDGVNVIEICPPTLVSMFHICLTRHAAITVGGMEMETFHPGASATRNVSYEMRDLFLSMFPHIAHTSDFGPLAHPRAPETVDVDVY